jgi:hypothetical protein
LNNVSDFLKRASQRNGFVRERYEEKNVPTEFGDVCILPFFGDNHSMFLLSAFFLHAYRKQYKSSKYFIVCSYPGMAGMFPYVDEFWGFSDHGQLPRVYEKSDGFENHSDIVAIYKRNLNEFFRNVIDIKDVFSKYGNGFKKEFTKGDIELFLPFVPSSSILSKEFVRQVNTRAGYKVMFSPTLYCKQWHNGKSRNVKSKREFWMTLARKLESNGFVPVVWQNHLTHDISSEMIDSCLFFNDSDITKVLSAMRACGCFIDVFNGTSRLAIMARTPFLCVDERSRYNNMKDYEVEDLSSFGLPKQHIFTFSTIITDGSVDTWNQDIAQNIVNRLNSFLPDLDRDNWPTTSETYDKVSFEDNVRTVEPLKIGKKLLMINRD